MMIAYEWKTAAGWAKAHAVLDGRAYALCRVAPEKRWVSLSWSMEKCKSCLRKLAELEARKL